MSRQHLSTLAAHVGAEASSPTHLVAPPIYESVGYRFESVEQLARRASGQSDDWYYGRYGHGNMSLLEDAVKRLEGAEHALACATGMSAIYCGVWAAVSKGDHVVAARDVYGGTFVLFRDELTRLDVNVTFVDPTAEAIEAALTPKTKLIYVETVSNPTARVVDLERVSHIAKRVGATLFVDNTIATPCLCRPFEFGVTGVIHSGTKYLSGHSDAMSGVFLSNDKDLVQRARQIAAKTGMQVAPFEAWLTLRGVRTLSLRVERQSQNAEVLARWLNEQSQVSRVWHPRLKSHPEREVAQRLLPHGCGSLFAFEVKGGVAVAAKVIESLHIAQFVPHLGDVSTLVTYPGLSSHVNVPDEERLRMGVTDGLIRVSVGIEDVGDIIEDFRQALESA
jgi:cystathionine beta-lyase/cystathionine gamma-synthase